MSSTKTSVACPSDDFHERWCLGVPYRSTRSFTHEEKALLDRRFQGFSIALVICLLLAVPKLVLGVGFDEYFYEIAFMLMVVSCFTVPVVLIGWIPLLRAVLYNRIDVYEGSPIALWEDDKSNKDFREQFEIRFGDKAQVEVIGNCILWTVNGDFAQREVYAYRRLVLLFPFFTRTFKVARSHRSELLLTSDERMELARSVLRYTTYIILQAFAIFLLGEFIYTNYVSVPEWSLTYILHIKRLVIGVFTVVFLVWPCLRNMWFTAQLVGDLFWRRLEAFDGEERTRLRLSKIAWTFDAQPASWRLSRSFLWKPPTNRLPNC